MTAAGLIAAKDRNTTTAAITRELATIELMKSGQNQVEAISTLSAVLTLTTNETTLTIGQYQALLESATSNDQVIAWQGVAAAGKTYSLTLLAQQAAHELLQKAQAEKARVILVGDTRQLSAVEAGNPF